MPRRRPDRPPATQLPPPTPDAQTGPIPPAGTGTLVQQLSDLYQPVLAEHGHDVVCDLQRGVVIDGDVGLINRAVTNLLDNEVAHLPAGCRVSLALRMGDEMVELAVEDDGPGFPASVKARAFERFVKGPRSTGHGLGLAFVQAVVQAHGGRVRIAEREGRGSRISVTLPVAASLRA